jgi:hypothetical protein
VHHVAAERVDTSPARAVGARPGHCRPHRPAIRHAINGRGPDEGRPLVDRIKGSRFLNLRNCGRPPRVGQKCRSCSSLPPRISSFCAGGLRSSGPARGSPGQCQATMLSMSGQRRRRVARAGSAGRRLVRRAHHRMAASWLDVVELWCGARPAATRIAPGGAGAPDLVAKEASGCRHKIRERQTGRHPRTETWRSTGRAARSDERSCRDTPIGSLVHEPPGHWIDQPGGGGATRFTGGG